MSLSTKKIKQVLFVKFILKLFTGINHRVLASRKLVYVQIKAIHNHIFITNLKKNVTIFIKFIIHQHIEEQNWRSMKTNI